MGELYTISQIAEQLEEPIPRVDYIVKCLRLKPVERVGLIRLFNEGQVARIKDRIFNMQVQKTRF